MHYVAKYEQRHPNLKDSDETDMINSYVPRVSPYCGSEEFIQNGHDNIGVIR